MKIAIVAVAYNRKESLERLLDSLDRAYYPESVTLIISIDKSKTDMVERYASAFTWRHGEKRVALHEKNLGLRAHMLSLGDYFDEFDAICIFEDDTIVSPCFYTYAKACVEKYHHNEHIAGISFYSYRTNFINQWPFSPAKSEYDVYLMNIAMSWGEVWMRDQWRAFKRWYDIHKDDTFDPRTPLCVYEWPQSSWLKHHIRYCIENNLYFVHPYHALSTNNAEAGENFKTRVTIYQSPLQMPSKKDYKLPEVDEAEIYYDGYFEPKFLWKYMDIDESELCVDFYGLKPKELYKRYVLSTRALPYHVAHSYALELRPFEMNIIMKRDGTSLWLYDTSITATPPAHIDRHDIYNYLYPKGFYNALFILGPRRISSLIFDLIVYKINKIFHLHFPTSVS